MQLGWNPKPTHYLVYNLKQVDQLHFSQIQNMDNVFNAHLLLLLFEYHEYTALHDAWFLVR